MRLTKSPVTLEPVAKRTPVSARQPGVQAVADKRKPVPSTPKKPNHPSGRAADADLSVGR
jgi:hypothetical protein